jgi:class 3 adenylate cyclase
MDYRAKTWLCSVVFLDIAGYTERSVTRQINMKGQLQSLIAETVAHTPESERVIVDTGDGAALCYLGDPEQALLAAMRLREAFRKQTDPLGERLRVRIGINLGPVKVVRTLSGQFNPLGDGINNAQRVMSFAQPNQILVSRSFYEVIACLSHEYARLLTHIGKRLDKHAREHDVYEVRDTVSPLAPPAGGAAGSGSAAQEGRVSLDAALLERSRQALAESIGPLAKVLVRKAAARAADAVAFADLLAESVPEAQRARFRERLGIEPPPDVAGNGGAVGAATGEHDAPSGPWEPDELRVAEERLAKHLGPLARILVQRTAQKTTDRALFYEMLAGELGSQEEQRAFLEAARPQNS